jgi:hypothetical protein
MSSHFRRMFCVESKATQTTEVDEVDRIAKAIETEEIGYTRYRPIIEAVCNKIGSFSAQELMDHLDWMEKLEAQKENMNPAEFSGQSPIFKICPEELPPGEGGLMITGTSKRSADLAEWLKKANEKENRNQLTR